MGQRLHVNNNVVFPLSKKRNKFQSIENLMLMFKRDLRLIIKVLLFRNK